MLLYVINQNVFVNIMGLFVFATKNPEKKLHKIWSRNLDY